MVHSISILQDSTNFSILETQLESINHDFADVSYVCGWIPTIKDTKFFDFCVAFIDDQLLSKWPHLKRWFTNVQSFDQIERNTFLEPKGSITSLVRKVDRLRNLCLFDKNVIDLKVRRLFTGKQNTYKLYKICIYIYYIYMYMYLIKSVLLFDTYASNNVSL